MPAPEFLAVGHVVQDVTASGVRLGGAAAFGALTAARLGLAAALVTCCNASLPLEASLPGVRVHRVEASQTTSFRNLYCGVRRIQHLLEVAPPLRPEEVPMEWRQTAIVLIAPVAREVGPKLTKLFPQALKGFSAQGWLRQWDPAGRVTPRDDVDPQALRGLDVVTVSEEDVASPETVESWAAVVPVVVLTRGSEGALLTLRGQQHRVDAFPAREVDPMGAGDVFAAALLVRYRETGDALAAVHFASAAASLSVEAEGLAGVPTRSEVLVRLQRDAQHL